MTRDKKVLVVGGGGRCHAIVDALSRSPQVAKIWCAPGNAGIGAQAECVPLKDTDVPGLLKKGKATAEETEAFMAEASRAKAEWIKAWAPGYVETPPAQAAAAAGSAQENERQASIARSNYLLGDLADQDRSKANVAKRKAKFEEALKKAQAPDKILGTYSTSRFWKGIPVFKDEALKAKWSSLQEMTYKSFYQKDGKYFVVTGGFRQGITHEDVKRGKSASEVADYWPGLDAPVEVPAELIEKHF